MDTTLQRIAIQRDMQLPNLVAHAFPIFMLNDEIKALVKKLIYSTDFSLVYIVELPQAWHIYVYAGKLYTRLAIPHQ